MGEVGPRCDDVVSLDEQDCIEGASCEIRNLLREDSHDFEIELDVTQAHLQQE